MQTDAQTVFEAFGKNEHVMWVIWALVVSMTDLGITKVLDPTVVHGDDIYHLEEIIQLLLPARVYLSSVGSGLVAARLVMGEMGMSFIFVDFYVGCAGI